MTARAARTVEPVVPMSPRRVGEGTRGIVGPEPGSRQNGVLAVVSVRSQEPHHLIAAQDRLHVERQAGRKKTLARFLDDRGIRRHVTDAQQMSVRLPTRCNVPTVAEKTVLAFGIGGQRISDVSAPPGCWMLEILSGRRDPKTEGQRRPCRQRNGGQARVLATSQRLSKSSPVY